MSVVPALVLAVIAAFSLGGVAADQASSPGPLPAAVKPFPPGLRGTLVFQSDISGRPALYTLALATGEVQHLTGDPRYTSSNPRWSPDGARVVFSSNRAHYEGASPERGTADMDLWTIEADGRGIARLTSDSANENDPAWSPDGRSLVYSSDRDSRGDLFRLTPATGAVTRLTTHFAGRAIMPAPAPDGQRVAFAAQSLRLGAFWTFQVHVLMPGGGTPGLTNTVGGCWPSWSPDGTRLAHVRLPEGEASSIEIRDGAQLERSTVHKAGALWSYYPEWSPDGSQIAFAVSPEHHEGENWDLAVMDARTGAWTRLTQGAGNDRLPDWKR